MLRKKPIQFFLLVILMVVIPQSFLWSSSLPPGCTSKQCHSTMQDNAKVHPANRKCSTCHQANGTAHPKDNQTNFTTTTSACEGCHPDITAHNYLHPPVAANDCLSCHLVHGEKRNNYINEQEKLFCYNCHNNVVIKGETVLHGEISENKCASCHAAHGSDYPGLLRANYSLEFFNDYEDKVYKLCFRCHKIDLLLHPRTSYNTKFRDGKKNLHYLHVNKKTKGRSCSSCHRTHASHLPHLMAETVPFGNWPLPINFQTTENGGKCSPGCHAPESYDRSQTRR